VLDTIKQNAYILERRPHLTALTTLKKGSKSQMQPNTQTPEHQMPETGPIVDILINNITRHIHRGRQSVPTIKTVGEVPLADELSQIIDGKLVPLADDASVTIKGHEQFISSPRTGRSS
jgi:hypothetical protein